MKSVVQREEQMKSRRRTGLAMEHAWRNVQHHLRSRSDVRRYFIFSYESLCRLEEFIYLSAHLVTRQARIYENLGHMPEVITHLFGLLAHSPSQN